MPPPQLLKIVRQEQHRGRAVLRFLSGGRAVRALGAALRAQERLTKVRHHAVAFSAALHSVSNGVKRFGLRSACQSPLTH